MQKPYAPKCGQGKTKIDLFRDFFTKTVYVQVMNFIAVKVSTLYIVQLFTLFDFISYVDFFTKLTNNNSTFVTYFSKLIFSFNFR
jgi:hypothetical protein